MKYPFLGYGLGVRAEHFEQVLNGESKMDWFEALAENYMGIPGCGQSPLLKKLLRLRQDYPVVFHCISSNIGSIDPLDFNFLRQLKNMVDLVQPSWVSDHLCWIGINQHSTHELLPLPYTKEAVEHVAERISKIQDFLGQRFMIENTSSYITYSESEMTEWEFICEIIKKTDCGLLLDINNVYVSSVNHNFDPVEFLTSIPLSNVGQIHIAGHSHHENGLIIDTHDNFVCDQVYDLVGVVADLFTSSHFNSMPSIMTEWDSQIPDLATYEQETLKAKNIVESRKMKNDIESVNSIVDINELDFMHDMGMLGDLQKMKDIAQV